MKNKMFSLIFCLSFFCAEAGDWPFQASEIPQPQELVFSEEDISFDTPDGKITKVKGQTAFYKLCDLKSFFEKSLLELGWSKEKMNSHTMKFKRDSSTVEIQLTESGFNTIDILIELVSSQQNQL